MTSGFDGTLRKAFSSPRICETNCSVYNNNVFIVSFYILTLDLYLELISMCESMCSSPGTHVWALKEP